MAELRRVMVMLGGLLAVGACDEAEQDNEAVAVAARCATDELYVETDEALAELRAPPAGSCHLGGFEGKTPCADCERLKMLLTLHLDEETLAPTTYVLERIEVGNGDERLVTRGTWARSVGTPWDADAGVVTLAGETPQEFTRYLTVGENLLLLLDEGLEPRVGDGAYSYTLSRAR